MNQKRLYAAPTSRRWIMQQRPWSKWSTIAWSIREAHLRCAVHNCFFAVIFGLRFLGQTWKKASWGSARRSRPRFARSTRNILLASIRLTRRSVLRSRLGNPSRCDCTGCPSAETAARTGLPAAFSGRETSELPPLLKRWERKDFLSRPLPNCDANTRADRTKKGTMVTGAAQPRRGRWRRAKSRRKLERVAKDQGRNTMAANGSVGRDPPDKLLLSALKYWEVERDLIEERLATMRSATAAF